MGRHSSPSQFHYYRSIIGWFLPWALVATIVGVGVWVGVDVLGGDEIQEPPAPAAASSPSPEASSEEPTPEPEVSEEPEPEPEPEKPAKPEPKLITEDITLQVLNATTSNPDADDQMADKLASLGFEVIAVGGANRVYQETTVFWSFAEAKKAAERLAARFGWGVAPKPSNLSTTVDLHVIVGEDFVN